VTDPDSAHDPAPLPGRESALRRRFDEPLERATLLTRRTLASFPIRVWRHFLQHNGFLLAAGISYQALFAILGALYLAFAAVGVWLGGSPAAIRALIATVNRYIPELISDTGLVKPEQVEAVASDAGRLLTVTGLVAAAVVVWTATGFVTYTRRAVRDTFGLPFDRRNYLMLKARDLLAAVLFGVALLVGATLGTITTGAVDLVLTAVGIERHSVWTDLVARLSSPVVAFGINTLALAGLVRFLTGTSLRWRRIWPGALLGAAAMVVLQVAAGFLFVYTPTNPLLATFAIFIGFLLWFRLNGIVILVSAAWIAVAAGDRDVELVSAAEQRATELSAVALAARVELREARAAAAHAPWWRRWSARRRVRAAEEAARTAQTAAREAAASAARHAHRFD
jgi:membrane protein